jgi:hypothetical protein
MIVLSAHCCRSMQGIFGCSHAAPSSSTANSSGVGKWWLRNLPHGTRCTDTCLCARPVGAGHCVHGQTTARPCKASRQASFAHTGSHFQVQQNCAISLTPKASAEKLEAESWKQEAWKLQATTYLDLNKQMKQAFKVIEVMNSRYVRYNLSTSL